jgi:hypothetical protein
MIKQHPRQPKAASNDEQGYGSDHDTDNDLLEQQAQICTTHSATRRSRKNLLILPRWGANSIQFIVALAHCLFPTTDLVTAGSETDLRRQLNLPRDSL